MKSIIYYINNYKIECIYYYIDKYIFSVNTMSIIDEITIKSSQIADTIDNLKMKLGGNKLNYFEKINIQNMINEIDNELNGDPNYKLKAELRDKINKVKTDMKSCKPHQPHKSYNKVYIDRPMRFIEAKLYIELNKYETELKALSGPTGDVRKKLVQRKNNLLSQLYRNKDSKDNEYLRKCLQANKRRSKRLQNKIEQIKKFGFGQLKLNKLESKKLKLKNRELTKRKLMDKEAQKRELKKLESKTR